MTFLTRLFDRAEVALTLIAEPLARIANQAIDRDPGLVTAQQARLSQSDLSGNYLVESDFGSANLEKVRFRRANISRSGFAALSPDEVLPPLPPQAGPAVTRLSSADFLRETVHANFSGVSRKRRT